jgi:hypothetical protein
VLAGAPGSTVTAVLRPHGSSAVRRVVHTTARPVQYRASVAVGDGPAGHEAQLHAYDQIADAGTWSLVAGYAAHAAGPAGAYSSLACMTTGSDNATTRQVGGVAPCADHQGVDILFGPWAGPLADRVGYAYAPVSSGGAAIMGPAGDPFGIGWDETVVAPSSHLRSVFFGVSLS